jgi:hypothetical protein
MQNTGIESTIIAKGFKAKVGKKGFFTLFAANMVSVGLASLSLIVSPIKTL